ncbi:MAG: response regulator transcription factor [Bacteroidetes bacterium]|nr:response regulator transcription factor [Bacteroidota bacterium]
MKISVAIVEDDKNYNKTLKRMLDYSDNLSCVGNFYSGKSALENLPSLQPDVVLMDLQLQDFFGYEIIATLKPNLLNTSFIVITNYEDEEMVFNTLKAGAVGYLVKGESLEKITNSIQETYQGGSAMSNSIARKIVHFFQVQNQKNNLWEILTHAEQHIIEAISKGRLYKEIADEKCISIETVKKHINNIYRKLGVNNKVEAINLINNN